jgi:hypothetical protein
MNKLKDAKTRRRKAEEAGQFVSLNSGRSRPAGETFFSCVFAPLRLGVKIRLHSYGQGVNSNAMVISAFSK